MISFVNKSFKPKMKIKLSIKPITFFLFISLRPGMFKV